MGGCTDYGSDRALSPRERARDFRREIAKIQDVQALVLKEQQLRSQMSGRLATMCQGVDRAYRDDSRSLKALHRAELVRTKKPPISRSLSAPSLIANSLSRSSHLEQQHGLKELEELEMLVLTVDKRRTELQERQRLEEQVKPVRSFGRGKVSSVESFDKWFANHGRPMGGSNWETWRSSNPDIRRRLGRY